MLHDIRDIYTKTTESTLMAFNRHMADIYQRLKPIGFDAEFVRSVILPDWWVDSDAEVPFNRALAETTIARFLKLSFEELSNPTAALSLPSIIPIRLKCANQNSDPVVVRPAIQVAQRLAEILARSAKEIPPFVGPERLREIRPRLREHHPIVTLEVLTEACWENGVIVAHMARLPKVSGFRKFDGLAMFVDGRPVVLLADPSDVPPWQAFHLAHELGHIALEHVLPGAGVLADGQLDRVADDDVERQADRFACEMLTGKSELAFNSVPGMTAEKLASAVSTFGSNNGIDPGVVALIYGRTAQRWGAAVEALKLLGMRHGAKDVIRNALASRLDLDSLQESQRHFLEQLVLPQAATVS